ncbi:uncharacterized protein IL334_001286 [Kwoniella shivajii]|uniref:Uncharacterized protein n=1 Tax=Kwoniella shivajii TaxID=564305 RepID=A0ABZ1CT45_9TREE|nr:hypothetical protein IL334_001286 [Kwoniella shivajii]
MLGKLTSFLSSSTPLPSSHQASARAKTYVDLAKELDKVNVPVSETDCISCSNPCDETSTTTTGAGAGARGVGTVVEIYEGKSYQDYINDKYGDLGELPKGFDVDWETDLKGSSKGGQGRIVVISTGKSDWERDHTDEKGSLANHLNKVITSSSIPESDSKSKSTTTSTNTNTSTAETKSKSELPSYITSSVFPKPSNPLTNTISIPPSLYSSSLISQSDDPSDQSTIIFPDWKVIHEIDNSYKGAKSLYDNALSGELGRSGKSIDTNDENENENENENGEFDRRRSWVLPYRAVILLCSHKKRDKRCHIAAPLLRSALHTVLSQHDISIDEDGSSLSHLDGPPIEEMRGTNLEKEIEIGKRIEDIEGVKGGQGGQVGIFNINHLGGHRYAGVMLILFPSGAYVSYGRVTPQEIPRVVEDTILQGTIVPGLLRNAVGVEREASENKSGKGFLSW